MYGWKGKEEYLYAEGYDYLIDFNGKIYTFHERKGSLLNDRPLYLVYTSNEGIAKKYMATKGKSLFYNKTVYIGFMMNIYANGIVTNSHTGSKLFKIENITKIDSINDNIRICTQNDVYDFAL